MDGGDKGTKNESMKKCKCKHTINCWHKTHKFKRKLNYVTQQLNSIYMVVILAFCSGRVFLSVVAGGRFGERSENCERFSSVLRIRLERKKWQEQRREDVLCVWLELSETRNSLLNEPRMMEVLINVLHFSFSPNLLSRFALSEWKFLHSHMTVDDARWKTQNRLWTGVCRVLCEKTLQHFICFFFVDSWKKNTQKEAK